MNNSDLQFLLKTKEKQTAVSLDLSHFTSFPTEVFQFTALNVLVLKNFHFSELPEGWAALKQLKHLRLLLPYEKAEKISWSGFPSDFFELKELELLRLEGLNMETLPKEFSVFTKLEELYLHKSTLRQIPDCIGDFAQLKILYLNTNKLESLPKTLSKLTQLTYLDISCNPITELPDLSAAKQLKDFSAPSCKLTKIPDYFCGFEELEMLYLRDNLLTKLPENLYKLPKLKHINIDENPIQEAPLNLLLCNTLEYLDCRVLSPATGKYTSCFSPNFSNNASRFFRYLAEIKTPTDMRLSLYHIFSEHQAEMAKVPLLHLLEAFKTDKPMFLDPAIAEVERRYAATKNPLKKGCELVIRGDIQFKKTELKQRLEKLGITTAQKVTAKTTHLVAGKKLNNTADCDRADLVVMTDRDLDRFFKSAEDQFLLQSSPEETQTPKQNLSEMLLSGDAANVGVALQILSSAGLPKDLITELFLVVKTPTLPDTMRKQAQQFLQLNGSPKLLENLKKRDKIIDNTIKEDSLYRNLNLFTKDTELDKKKIGAHLLSIKMPALKFHLSVLTPEERLEYVRKLITDDTYTIDYSRYWWTYQNELAPLAPLVRRLSLESNKLRKIEPFLYKFHNLEYLNLCFNSLKQLPEEFAQLQQLKELDLYQNEFDEFPEVLLKMPNLETIHLGSNRCALDKDKLPYHLFEDATKYRGMSILQRKKV